MKGQSQGGNTLTEISIFFYMETNPGDVAQQGERRVRNAKARGSIPLISTI